MITFAELHAQNHKISELSHVIANLIKERSLCDTEITSELFFDFAARVQDHLELEDHELYSELLRHSDQNIRNTADRFMSGSQEIKRVFKSYLRRWCSRGTLLIDNHKKFVQDTEDMFQMVLNRVQDETERLYPLIREIDGAKAA